MVSTIVLKVAQLVKSIFQRGKLYIFRFLLKRIGKNVIISGNVRFYTPSLVEIGENVFIGNNTIFGTGKILLKKGYIILISWRTLFPFLYISVLKITKSSHIYFWRHTCLGINSLL